ncbi:hypothetical protein DYB25_008074, partial [Aphanomyces astaci]
MSQVHLKCSEAAATLRELVLAATERGISVEDSFGHFDPTGEGVVDLPQFILGLRTLGIPLSVEAASLLLRQLSDTSTTHLTVQDFHRLCAKRHKLSQDNHTRPTQPSTEQRVAQAQGLPQWAHDRSKRALKELQQLSKNLKPSPLHLGPRDDFKDGLFSEDEDGDDTSLDGPATSPPVRPSTPPPETTYDATRFQVYAVNDHVDLRYAILTAPVDAVEDSMRWTGEAQALDHSQVTRQLKTPKSQLGVKLIAVIDVFQTLDLVEAALQPLFQVYTSAKVLVIGHPCRMDSATVSYFQDKRQLALSLDDELTSSGGVVHVSWLKGGHELLQERPTFLHSFLDQLVTAAQRAMQAQSTSADDNGGADDKLVIDGTSAVAGGANIAMDRLVGDGDVDELTVGQSPTITRDTRDMDDDNIPQL